MDISQGMTRRSVRLLIGMIFRRWYWPALSAIFFGFALSLFVFHNYLPEYKISITFIPAKYLIDLNGSAVLTGSGFDDAITRSFTYTQLVKDNQIRDAVRKAVGFNISKDEFDEAISTSVNENSAAITINVTWKDAKEASEISNALKAYLTYVIAHTTDVGVIKWVDGYSTELLGSSTTKLEKSTLFFMFGAIFGLCFGACFSLFLGVLDRRVFDLESVRYGGNVNTIGIINRSNWLLWLLKRINLLNNTVDRNLYYQPHKQLMAVSVIIRNMRERDGKKLMLFTAPTQKCGTSTVVRKIARILSNNRMRILLITVKRPNHPYSQETDDLTISSTLSGFDECVYFWDDTSTRDVFFQPISEIVSPIADKYDLILVDAPALLNNIELTMLLKGMDSILLVFRYGRTKFEEVLSAVTALQKAEAEEICCVWNCTDVKYIRKPYSMT